MSNEIVCVSPIDGQIVARRRLAIDSEVNAAVQGARRAQREWARVPVSERCQYVLQFLDGMLAMRDDMVPELALQMGRPVRYGGEMRPFEERVRYMVSIAESSLAPLPASDSQANSRRFITRSPVGLVLVIAPWNYPYLTAVNTIVPALLAGNAVLLKHASQTPLAGERFAAALQQAGLPQGLFANLFLSHAQTERLLASRAVDHVNFTGSVSGGQAVERAVAGTFTSVGLELGGKDPAYVRADADLPRAIENLVDGTFYNTGQCCCGIERIYVHASRYEEFVDGFVELTKQYVLGNPLEPATTLGPMAQTRLADLVRAQTNEAVARGAVAHIAPEVFPACRTGTPYLGPQVLTKVNHGMRVMMEENFGPLVGIMSVPSDDHAVQLMNHSAYGLTASLWTADEAAAEQIGQRLETGTVFMNRCDYLDPALAWTGVKNTGRGVSLSPLGYGALTRPKSFHLRQ